MCERKNTMYWGACVRVDTFNSALELSLRVNSRLCLVHFPIDPVLWPWVGSFVVAVDWLWRIYLAFEFLFLLCINFTTRESLFIKNLQKNVVFIRTKAFNLKLPNPAIWPDQAV